MPEALVSGSLFGVNTQFHYVRFIARNRQGLMCIVTFPRVPHEGPDNFTPQVQYEYNQHKLIGLKGELGKYLKNNGYCNIYYEKNYKSQFQSVGIGFRYNFSFAQIGFTARQKQLHIISCGNSQWKFYV